MTVTLDSLDRITREHARQLEDHERRLNEREVLLGKVMASVARIEAQLTDLDLVRLEVVGLRTIVAQAMSIGGTTRVSDRPVSKRDFDKAMNAWEEKTNPGMILETGVKLWAVKLGVWAATRAGRWIVFGVGGTALVALWHAILALTGHLR